MQKIFQIDLDIKNPQNKSVPPLEVVSGDTGTNILNINLLEDFKSVNASGNTAVITFVKSDGTTVFQNLSVVNATKGQYTCTLSSQTIAAPGRVKAEVSLYEGTKRLTSVRFEFNVRKALLDDGTVESSNEFSALTQALSEVTDLKNLAGEGRTTETVKGNADAIAEHSADIVTDADGVHGLKIEEGIWTPQISGTYTYSSQKGHYYRVGNYVYLRAYIKIDIADTTVGVILLGALPYIRNADEVNYMLGSATISGVSLGSGYTDVYAQLTGDSSSSVYLRKYGSGAQETYLNKTELTNGCIIRVTGLYKI